MCQTGGPRCYTEASRRFTAAQQTFQTARETLTRLERDPSYQAMPYEAQEFAVRPVLDQFEAARRDYWNATVELAATRRGRAEVEAMWASTDPMPEFAGPVEDVLADAEWMKKRGRMVRAIRDPEQGPETVVGFTGDPEDDRLILHAVEAFAADPAAHRSPGVLKKVKRYTSEGEKVEGVRRWTRATQGAAERYRQAQRRLVEVEADAEDADSDRAEEMTRTLTWARNDTARAAVRLVAHAEKLRIAKNREVPSANGRESGTTAAAPVRPESTFLSGSGSDDWPGIQHEAAVEAALEREAALGHDVG